MTHNDSSWLILIHNDSHYYHMAQKFTFQSSTWSESFLNGNLVMSIQNYILTCLERHDFGRIYFILFWWWWWTWVRVAFMRLIIASGYIDYLTVALVRGFMGSWYDALTSFIILTLHDDMNTTGTYTLHILTVAI